MQKDRRKKKWCKVVYYYDESYNQTVIKIFAMNQRCGAARSKPRTVIYFDTSTSTFHVASEVKKKNHHHHQPQEQGKI